MPKVSVVVPIYGVEKYIERCARSLFEQTLDDMEFVFVDDCTRDNSMAVLESVIKDYPNRQDQIKIIHHEHNRGLSYARETGVNNATGDFIGHCDSDDWVEKEMYESLYTFAIDNSYDYVRCAYSFNDGFSIQKQIFVNTPLVNNDKTEILSLLLRDKGWNAIWVSLARADLYKSVQYTKYAMLEDFVVSIQLLSKANSIGVLNIPFYNYYVNPDSICRVPTEDKILDRAFQARENVFFILSYIPADIKKNLRKKEEIIIKYIARRFSIGALTKYSNYKYWNSVYKEIGCKPLFCGDIEKKERLRYLLALIYVYPVYNKLFR